MIQIQLIIVMSSFALIPDKEPKSILKYNSSKEIRQRKFLKELSFELSLKVSLVDWERWRKRCIC